MSKERKVPLQDMAIDTLNYIDGERDYFEWKQRKTHGLKGGLDIRIFIYIEEYCRFSIVHMTSCK